MYATKWEKYIKTDLLKLKFQNCKYNKRIFSINTDKRRFSANDFGLDVYYQDHRLEYPPKNFKSDLTIGSNP